MKTNPLRFILSLVCGVALAYFVTIFFQYYAPQIIGYEPLSENADVFSMETYLSNLPTKAIIALIASTAIGGFAGGYTATRITHSKKKIAALSVGVFSTVITIFMIIAFSYPLFLSIGLCAVLIPSALIGGKLAGFNS